MISSSSCSLRRREIAGTHLSALKLLRAILKDPLDLAEIDVEEAKRLGYTYYRAYR